MMILLEWTFKSSSSNEEGTDGCNSFWWSSVTNLPSTLLTTKQWETGETALQLSVIKDVYYTSTSLQLCLLYIEHILIYEEEQ